jgi:hypothetical protein
MASTIRGGVNSFFFAARRLAMHGAHISKCIITFFIGLFAGCCAAFFPRLAAMVATQDTEKIVLFSSPFVIAGFALAAIIGVAMVIIEYGAQRSPRDTFATALGIPAVLAGALTTTVGVSDLNNQISRQQELIRTVVTQGNIPKSDDAPATITPLEAAPPVFGIPHSLLENLLGIRPAYAQENVQQAQLQRQFGIQVREPQYAVVLEEAASEEDAKLRAAKLRGSVPNATAVKANDRYRVIDGVLPKPESEAVVDAARIKAQTGRDVSLIRVK